MIYSRELMEAFPNAKVILTIRDPEAWYRSVSETIYQGNLNAASFPQNILSKIYGRPKSFDMIQNLARRKTNRFNDGNYAKIIFLAPRSSHKRQMKYDL